jgi:hypothetical protein
MVLEFASFWATRRHSDLGTELVASHGSPPMSFELALEEYVVSAALRLIVVTDVPFESIATRLR